MKLCSRHTGLLTDVLTARGLASLFPKSEEDALRRFEIEKVEPTPQSFDPMTGGIYWIERNLEETCSNDPHFDPENKRLVRDESGALPCPICFANARVVEMDAQNSPDTFDVWIEWIVEDAVEEATKRGLVGAA